MHTHTAKWIAGAALAAAIPLAAAQTVVTINALDEKGIGKPLGTVEAQDSKDGLVLAIKLTGLTPGDHGFHVHENADCGAKERDGRMTAGLGAGGHYDPQKTGKHEGPKGAGHRGDLPVLKASQDGTIIVKVVAPRLNVADLRGRSIMIHEGGDNYSDKPKPLGGGAGRIACGVVK